MRQRNEETVGELGFSAGLPRGRSGEGRRKGAMNLG